MAQTDEGWIVMEDTDMGDQKCMSCRVMDFDVTANIRMKFATRTGPVDTCLCWRHAAGAVIQLNFNDDLHSGPESFSMVHDEHQPEPDWSGQVTSTFEPGVKCGKCAVAAIAQIRWTGNPGIVPVCTDCLAVTFLEAAKKSKCVTYIAGL
jgi:hypothetical protein